MAPKGKMKSGSGNKSSGSFFGGRKPVSSSNGTTFIEKGLSIEGGTIKGDGNVRIDGYFVGDIEIKGDVEIGASGAVYGDINANCATISGNCKGSINAESKIVLTSTAVVEGALNSSVVVIHEQAVFNGMCKMETNVQLPDARVLSQKQAVG